ncbi:MAG: glycoside hydrolase family 24 [Asticcacaulis sp. 32-58-5]|nr:MAG: glycoside hydrolase family 24 [Asticcacaulis sp. 32-58-5]
MTFHNIRFPVRLAFGSGVSIERKVEITSLAYGHERRISPWAQGRRHFLIGAGVRSLTDAAELLNFYEAREGRLYGFRFKDFADFKSGPLNAAPSSTDQVIGTGDGVRTTFQLTKAYGAVVRPITKPVSGTAMVAVNGVETPATVDFATGQVTFEAAPTAGAAISAGFEFDVPVRFNSDRIEMTLENFEAGRVAAVALIEIRG